MDDAGLDGKAECRRMQRIVRSGLSGSGPRILAASIRDVETLTKLAATGGLDTFTVSPDVARSLFRVPLTDRAAVEFEQIAQRSRIRGDQRVR
jgi:transaldolase